MTHFKKIKNIVNDSVKTILFQVRLKNFIMPDICIQEKVKIDMVGMLLFHPRQHTAYFDFTAGLGVREFVFVLGIKTFCPEINEIIK